MELDDLAVYCAMMIELGTRMGDMGEKEYKYMEDTSGYEKSGVQPE
jgi:hypothetical protein